MLATELRSNHESGQPFIYEHTFGSGRIRILVVWDEWNDLSLEQRTDIILAAVEISDGKEYRDRVALANGVTMPEGAAAGMLPYQIITALRKSDPLTPEQCRKAMAAEGASILLGPETPLLRFPTAESAEACRKRLAKKLPKSDEIWVVTRDLPPLDVEQIGSAIAEESV